MDHIKVLKRAFQITWDYKTLWIFGIILALTVGGGSYSGNGSSSGTPEPGYTFEGDEQWEEIPESIELPDGREVTVPQALREVTTWIAIGATVCGLCCIAIIIWIVVTTVARYVAETSLIRMVDDYEETGEKRTIREGFRMGWSRISFRLFLIDLLVFLAGLAVFVPLFLILGAVVTLVVIAMVNTGPTVVGIVGIVAAGGLFFLLILLAILVGIAVQFVKPYVQRACVLEELGVIDSIKYGLAFVRRHLLWDAVVMQLIVVGLYFGWFIAMVFVTFVLLAAAVVAAAIPVLVLGGLGSLIIGWPAWIVGGLFGLLSFTAVVVVPSVLLRGLEMTFISTLWTLTYRELKALEGLEPEDVETLEEED